MIKIPNTLGFRLTLSYTLAFALVFVSALGFLYLSINTILNERIDDDLREDIAEFRLFFNSGGIEKVKLEIE